MRPFVLAALSLLLAVCEGVTLALVIAAALRGRGVWMGGGPIRADTIPKLVELVTPMARGLDTSNKQQIIAIINDIESSQAAFVAKDKGFAARCNGRWELLWTTEKETLFFAKNGLFGSKVKSITQTIDTKDGFLNNLISFDNGREFSVLGSVTPDSSKPSKFNFEFTSAEIKIPPLPKLRLPPVGSGWFENVYVNDLIRLSRDVRGDYLVSRRLV